MSFTPASHLWAPQRRGVEETIAHFEAGATRVCLYSPTGGGKTEQAIDLFRWANSLNLGGCFYVNRKLLVGQTAARFRSAGLHYGIRAAEYEDHYNLEAPFQVCSADTERARVYERKIWDRHNAGLVVVDEAHIQKGDTMRRILVDHIANGAKVVLLTATPIGLSKWADKLVISGRLDEYRACKALVLARVFSCQQPDLSKVQRNVTGEYVLDGKKKKIYTQTIVSDVISQWKEHNPDARPTMLYAPGKAESAWFTEKFTELGVNWCHVDATDAVVDGIRTKLTRPLWEEILQRFKANDIKGLSSRFKLREGIDCPSTYHVILATPIGSLASYIQTVGRVLRYSPETPEEVIVTDHGGNYWRHGSPNADRPWDAWWEMPEGAVSNWNHNQIRDGKAREAIRCPKCGQERTGGIKCPNPKCEFVHPKSQREVIMEDGTLVPHNGKLLRKRHVEVRSNTESLWSQLYWAWKRKGVAKSFSQMYGYFYQQYGYQPPRDLAFMPVRDQDWYGRHVHEVEVRNLGDRRAA